MPLNLLGKKSWNVYSKENIERVRRDEAAAAAREAEEDQRTQEHDAARRLAILRGRQPPSPSPPLADPAEEKPRRARDGDTDRRKRRRLAGEDDTDRDIRLARDTASDSRDRKPATHTSSDAPLHGQDGHIELFPVSAKAIGKGERNADAEAEKRKRQREMEDQYTMRFSNAAGREGLKSSPWYAGQDPKGERGDGGMEAEGKNVWGRPDPGRRRREEVRAGAADPLGAMRRAQGVLKRVARERREWGDERRREGLRLERQHEEERRGKTRRRRDDDEGLEGFSLDVTGRANEGRSRESAHRRSQHGDSEYRKRRHRRHSNEPRENAKDRRSGVKVAE